MNNIYVAIKTCVTNHPNPDVADIWKETLIVNGCDPVFKIMDWAMKGFKDKERSHIEIILTKPTIAKE